ncbi:MAG: arginase family protein [Thermosediminibacteraceae bacterium]|nr:arginase family protein [Thermosediminibacteraceae bacterium]
MALPAVNIVRSDESLSLQKKLMKKANYIFDLAGVKGLRFCAEKKHLMKLKQNIKSSKPGITFLGPGDFHHLSINFIERINPKPVLVLFDHHSDMLGSPEGYITCGSWVAQTLGEGKVKKCIVIGVSSSDEALLKSPTEGKATFIPEDLPHEKKVSAIAEELTKTGGPVYVSIDKDVLSKEDAATNWDQGLMSLEELLDLIEVIGEIVPIAGADVCGEWRVPDDLVFLSGEDVEKAGLNEEANLRILEKLLKVWQKGKKNGKISLYKNPTEGGYIDGI